MAFTHRESLQVFKEPLKECQVEGYLLTVEPELLFGNLEELCQVCFSVTRTMEAR